MLNTLKVTFGSLDQSETEYFLYAFQKMVYFATSFYEENTENTSKRNRKSKERACRNTRTRKQITKTITTRNKRGKKMKNKAIGSNWADVRKAMFTSEEIAASDKRVAILASAITATRKSQKISQRKLELLSGVKQPVISRLENGDTNPTIATLLKILEPLGKTLSIVDLK